MSMKHLDENSQLALREKAKEELERLRDTLSDNKTKEMVDNFKDKFSMCEIVYKVILEDHQFHKNGKHPQPRELKINMNQAPHALNYAGYDFDKELLTKLFGAEMKTGKKSVKKLRDSLTHSLNKNAIDELALRYDELNQYMDAFLDKISTYDAA